MVAHFADRATPPIWRAPEPRSARTWVGHLDINEGLLATCLVSDGVLEQSAEAARHVTGSDRHSRSIS